MTFHAAHNYGSVLQAYATQRVVEALGYSCEIINYRLPNQRAFYNGLYSTRFGMREFAQRAIRLPEHAKRAARAAKFEAFIGGGEFLRPSEREYGSYEALRSAKLDYDVLLSGSDQLWNRHCVAEFRTEPRESILGYYLAFGREDAKRIAFSSSIGGMTRGEMEEFRELLGRYSRISVREPESAEMLSELLGREIAATVDPTLMLNREQWRLNGTYDVPERYVLVYSLRRLKDVPRLVRRAQALARRHRLKLVCVSPFSPVYAPGVRALADCGPLDFLSYLRGAELVLTDSFHGSAFSVNLERPFYSIVYGAKDFRKNSLLRQFGLEDRILAGSEGIEGIGDFSCDFSEARQRLARRREESLSYLRGALDEAMKGGEQP